MKFPYKRVDAFFLPEATRTQHFKQEHKIIGDKLKGLIIILFSRDQ